MRSTHKCLKEWNATIEALGQGKQTILIRNYKTNLPEFLLYPTVSYASKDNFLESFQDQYHDFVRSNSLPDKKGDKVLIKYFASLEGILEKSTSRMPSEIHYIWTKEHVKNYMTSKMAYIWLLRVYALKEPYWAEPTLGAIKYANLNEEVSLEGVEPVLTNSEFSDIINKLR